MSNNYALGFPSKIKTNPIIIAGAKYSNEYFPFHLQMDLSSRNKKTLIPQE
jgi:hypothetical protein